MAHAFATRRKEETNAWKGADAGYSAKHKWLERNLTKTGRCKKCGRKERTQWANKSGRYLREANDYVELCSSCHQKYDYGNTCVRGHELAGSNLYVRKDRPSSRVCRQCVRDRLAAHQKHHG